MNSEPAPLHPLAQDMLKRHAQEQQPTIGFSTDTFFFPMDKRPMKGHMAAVKGGAPRQARGRTKGRSAKRRRASE